jgi:hypothetical protein
LIDGIPPSALRGYNIIRPDLLHFLDRWPKDEFKDGPREMESTSAMTESVLT